MTEEQEVTPIDAPDGEATTQRSTVGIIYPPPEVRNIVDKTAIFVARNGPVFEAKIQQNEISNPKFNFLNPTDPYHSYYRHKVKEVIEGNAPAEPILALKPALSVIQKPAQEQFKLPEAIVLKDPPPEPEFIIEPPHISPYDLDVVKVTAQFVARNGRQFLNNLMNRESRNFQFDFLRPQHSIFNYFTKLVEQYTKILLPSKDMLSKLHKQADDPKNLFDEAMYKIEWMKQQEREKRKEEDEKEKERVAYAQIDWHTFVVVETLELFESGNLPPPTIPEEVGSRLIALERYQQHGDLELIEPEPEAPKEIVKNNVTPKEKRDEEVPSRGADTRVQDMEEDSDSEEEGDQQVKVEARHPSLLKDAPQKINAEQIIIRKDYDPKAHRLVDIAPSADVFLTSPFTNEKVPAHKMPEHMRIGLLDPRWIEQRDKAIQDRREQEEVYAHGSSIGSNLKQLAERRSDIFGSGTEETQIGRKIGEEEKKEKVKETWDGHSTSSEKICQKARENISIEDQIAVIHKTKGLLYDEEKEKIGPAMPKHPQMSSNQLTSATLISPAQPPSFTNAHGPPMMRPPIIPAPPVMRPMISPMAPSRPMGLMGQLPILMGQPSGQHGVMPHIPMGRPPFMPTGGLIPGHMMPPMHPPHPMLSIDDDEPPYKRSKLEESFIPEHEYLARSPSHVEFKVQLPMIEKSEWKLNGQMFPITLPLSDMVSVIKAKIFDEIGMPAGKQKLQLDSLFLKDSNTLAYYNMNPSSVVLLQVKERGGRKK